MAMSSIVNISQVNIEELIRDMGEKKVDNGRQCDVVELTETDIGIAGSERLEKKEIARKKIGKKRKQRKVGR